MANNKVQLSDGTVLIDLTDATATADKIVYGYDAYGADGTKITGTILDGNELQYGTSSCLVGTAKAGTGYCWTELTGDIAIVGRATIETSIVA